MKPSLLDAAVAAEIRDPSSQYGLRMTVLSKDIRELRVNSPSGSRYVSLGMQTNFDDPLGKEWAKQEDAAIPSLLPGQTAEWKVRLEIFGISSRSTAAR